MLIRNWTNPLITLCKKNIKYDNTGSQLYLSDMRNVSGFIKNILMFFKDEQKSLGFGKTWGWITDDNFHFLVI